MKIMQPIATLLALLLLTACSTNTNLGHPDEAGPSEQTSNMGASAAEPEDGTEEPSPPEIEASEEEPVSEIETLLITTTIHSNGVNDDDGIDLIVYAYDLEAQTLAPVFRKEHYIGTYPANVADFTKQIVYFADAKPGERYDNLYSCDLTTGSVFQLTDGKNLFNDMLLIDGTLYANVAREFCNCCQPARFDFEAQDFAYRDETDDDTEHTSFSYDSNGDGFLILTDRLSETRTHRVNAETFIEPKTISLLDKDFQTSTKLFFTEEFQIYLTRRLDEDTILMTTEPQMVSGKRTLKCLDIKSQEVEDFSIPGIRQVHRFYPSANGNTLFFTGQLEGSTNWDLYRYELDTQELKQIEFPDRPRQIVDFQITRQPCGPDFSRGCCTAKMDETAEAAEELGEWYEAFSKETDCIRLQCADDAFSAPIEITDEDAVREIVSAIDFSAWVPLSEDEIPSEGPGYFLNFGNGTIIGVLADEPIGFVGTRISFEREAGELVNCILEGGPDGAFAFSRSLLDVIRAAVENTP